MATFPDISEVPEYPGSLDGLQAIQDVAKDLSRIPPFVENQIAGAGEFNRVLRNLVDMVRDARGLISAYGLDPDAGTPDDLTKVGELATIPDSQIAWVDNGRTEVYTEDGSRARPFKSVVTGIASGKSHVFLIGPPSFEFLTAPISLTQLVKVQGLTPTIGVGGFHKHIITFVASDGFVVKPTPAQGNILLELQDITILVLAAGAACVKLDNTDVGSRLKIRDCQLRTFFAGQFGLKTISAAASPSSLNAMQIFCIGNNGESTYGQVDLEFETGVPQTGTPIEFSGIRFDEGLATNTAAIAHKIRLDHCRLKAASISGGDALHTIEAMYCSTGILKADTVALLDATTDFTGAHTKVVLPIS